MFISLLILSGERRTNVEGIHTHFFIKSNLFSFFKHVQTNEDRVYQAVIINKKIYQRCLPAR